MFDYASMFKSIDDKMINPIRQQEYLDYGNKREAHRQNEFLSEVAEPSGESQARFMDKAYPGTSPWERLGSNAASPVQSPGAGTGSNASNAYLGSMTAIQQAKIGQETAIKTTKMNNETQKEINNQNTVGGQLPDQQRIESASRVVVNNADSERTWQNITLDQARMLLDAGTREKVDLPGYKSESNTATPAIRELLKDTRNNTNMAEALRRFPPDERDQIMRTLKKLAGQALKQANKGADFLGSMFKQK